MPFTSAQLRAGYARNAVGLQSLLTKAERTGKKANGFTADQLRERVTEYLRLSTATDQDLRIHLSRQTGGTR